MSNVICEEHDLIMPFVCRLTRVKYPVSCISAAAKKSAIKEAEASDLMKKWLKNASDREGGRQKRLIKKLGEILF